MYVYSDGIMNKVSTKANIKPPIMVNPIGILLVEESPNANAIGNAPNMVDKLVIKIGRKRSAAASVAACIKDKPASRF